MLKVFSIITIIILTSCGSDPKNNPMYYGVAGPLWDKASDSGDAWQAKMQAKIEQAEDRAADQILAEIIKLNKLGFGTYLVLFKHENIFEVMATLMKTVEGFLKGYSSLTVALSEAQLKIDTYGPVSYKVYDSNGNVVFNSEINTIGSDLQTEIDALNK